MIDYWNLGPEWALANRVSTEGQLQTMSPMQRSSQYNYTGREWRSLQGQDVHAMREEGAPVSAVSHQPGHERRRVEGASDGVEQRRRLSQEHANERARQERHAAHRRQQLARQQKIIYSNL